MKIEKNKVVALSYTLYKNDEKGEVLEVCTADKPLQFVFAKEQLLPKFEENIVNLEGGDDFDFVLESKEAYGEHVDDAIVDVPLEVFTMNGVVQKDILFPGSQIPMRDNTGRPITGVVVRVDEPNAVVIMDFNHPLAGINLYFTGKVESVREATEEELTQGMNHSCDSCGGSCESGSCGTGSCGEDESDCGCCGSCH